MAGVSGRAIALTALDFDDEITRGGLCMLVEERTVARSHESGAPGAAMDLVPSPLLPPGLLVSRSRFIHPSTRMRELLETEPYLFGPGVYDPLGAQQVMYYGFKAV